MNPSNPLASKNVSSSNNSNPSTSKSDQLTYIRYEDNATLTEQITHTEAIWSAIVAEHDLLNLLHFVSHLPFIPSNGKLA